MPVQPPADDPWDAAHAADPTTRLVDPFDAAMRDDPAFQPSPTPSQSSVPAQPGAPPAQSRPVGQTIADTATRLVGENAAAIRPFLRQNGQSLDPTQMPWCAAFVNGVLASSGVQGVTGGGRNVATSFLNWGVPAAEPQPGDVLVLPRGLSAGATGGHVGIATGQIADGRGGSYYLMTSGNEGDRVQYTWEPARSVVVRRAPPPGQTR